MVKEDKKILKVMVTGILLSITTILWSAGIFHFKDDPIIGEEYLSKWDLELNEENKNNPFYENSVDTVVVVDVKNDFVQYKIKGYSFYFSQDINSFFRMYKKYKCDINHTNVSK